MSSIPDFSFQVSSVMTVSKAAILYRTFLLSVDKDIPGDVAEFGIYHGETARELSRALTFLGNSKHVFMFDTCTGLPQPSSSDPTKLIGLVDTIEDIKGLYASDDKYIKSIMHDADNNPLRNYTLIKGKIQDTSILFNRRLSFAHIDFDLYEPTCVALKMCFDFMNVGGYIVIDDYGTEWTGVTRAVDEMLRPNSDWRLHQSEIGQILATRAS